MASSNSPKETHWFRDFRTKFYPDKDIMTIIRTFNKYWSHSFNNGDSYARDPKGNVMCLGVTKGQYIACFTSGVLKMAEFYHLKSIHTVMFYYMGSNMFDMRIFTLDDVEVNYPFVLSNREPAKQPDHWFRSFRTTLHPDKDVLKIGRTFMKYWSDSLISGNSHARDPRGNLMCLGVTKGSIEAYFTSGVILMAEFYQLKTNHNVVLHFMGNNMFDMRIFSIHGIEVNYPVVISDSESEDLTERSSWTIQLTKAAATGTNPLVIPAKFVREVLLQNQDVIYLIDEGGRRFECSILRSKRSQSERYLSNKWFHFMRDKGLAIGDRLKFWTVDDPHELFVQIIKS